MKKNLIRLLILLPIIFILIIFYISLNKDPIYSTESLIGKKIEKINLSHFNENRIITENDLKKNDYTLINFWASWCSPCRKEHPFLMELKNEKRLKLLGVNFKDDKKNALKFLNELGNPYYELSVDSSGKNSINFGVYGIPESILINNNLIIIKKIVGPISMKDYENILNIIK